MFLLQNCSKTKTTLVCRNKRWRFIISGKNGHYFRWNVTDKDSEFAFVGCSAENSRSPVVKVSLNDPLPTPVSHFNRDSQCKSGINE